MKEEKPPVPTVFVRVTREEHALVMRRLGLDDSLENAERVVTLVAGKEAWKFCRGQVFSFDVVDVKPKQKDRVRLVN